MKAAWTWAQFGTPNGPYGLWIVVRELSPLAKEMREIKRGMLTGFDLDGN